MQIVKALLLGAAAIAALSSATSADASVVIDISETGSDILLTASGTFDQTLATIFLPGSSGGFTPAVGPQIGFAAFGTQSAISLYNLTGPNNFGSGAVLNTAANSGLAIGLNATAAGFFISSTYVNNSQISSSAIVENRTLASAGFESGVYNYFIGGNALTINIGQATGAVPEPGTWAMMLLGFGAIGYSMRRRRKAVGIAQLT